MNESATGKEGIEDRGTALSRRVFFPQHRKIRRRLCNARGISDVHSLINRWQITRRVKTIRCGCEIVEPLES